jgi:hypothetical protein
LQGLHTYGRRAEMLFKEFFKNFHE